MQVVPDWADKKKAAFEVLVKNWIGENPDFKAVSDRNKANRGNQGTHKAGSSSTGHYRKRMVHIYIEQVAFISLHVFHLIRITFIL